MSEPIRPTSVWMYLPGQRRVFLRPKPPDPHRVARYVGFGEDDHARAGVRRLMEVAHRRPERPGSIEQQRRALHDRHPHLTRPELTHLAEKYMARPRAPSGRRNTSGQERSQF
jgi:hypothetical protein